jgi:opacity protein-like surface antigen
MKRTAFTILALFLGSAAASADELGSEPELPRSLSEIYDPQFARQQRGGPGNFSLGAIAGYVRVRDADEGTWHGGIVARYQMGPMMAVEGSISFHQEEFADGDIKVTSYPVQVSLLLYPLPGQGFRPYGLAGATWSYTRFDYSSSLGGGDETDKQFAFHLGAGAEISLGARFTIFADYRWLFLDEPGVDNSNIQNEKFDTWMVTIGALIRF